MAFGGRGFEPLPGGILHFVNFWHRHFLPNQQPILVSFGSNIPAVVILLHFFVQFQVFLCDPDGYFIKFCAFNHVDDAVNALNLKVNASTDDQPNDVGGEEEEHIRGIRKFWKKVSH